MAHTSLKSHISRFPWHLPCTCLGFGGCAISDIINIYQVPISWIIRCYKHNSRYIQDIMDISIFISYVSWSLKPLQFLWPKMAWPRRHVTTRHDAVPSFPWPRSSPVAIAAAGPLTMAALARPRTARRPRTAPPGATRAGNPPGR